MKDNPQEVEGKVINGYKVNKMIGISFCTGQGKFSYVYRGEKIDNNLPVALKFIKVYSYSDI